MSVMEGATDLLQVIEGKITGESTAKVKTVKDKEILITERLMKQYDTSDRENWVTNALEDDQFRNGVQWKNQHIVELERRLQVPIVVNVIQPAIDQGISMLTANNPSFQATAREDSDVDTANLYSDIMSWIWYISDGNVELKQVIDDMYVRGMGAMIVYIDPNADKGAGEVMVKAINPLDLRLPPSCQNRFARDAESIIIPTVESRANLILRHPDKQAEIDAAPDYHSGDRPSTGRFAIEDQVVDKALSGFDSHDKEVLDRYTKIKVTRHRILDSTNGYERVLDEDEYKQFLEQPAVLLQDLNGQEQIITRPDEVAKYLAISAEGDGVFHLVQKDEQQIEVPGLEGEGAIPGSTVVITVTNMAFLIKEEVILDVIVNVDRVRKVESVGNSILFKGILPISEYPIITFMNRHNRNPYPLSDVRFVKGLQEYINKIRSLIIAHATNTTNQKIILAQGSGLTKSDFQSDFSRAGSAVLESRVGPDEDIRRKIMIVAPPPLPNELYKNMDDAKQEVMYILGLYPVGQGDPRGAPTTFRGTVALDEYGQRRTGSKGDDMEAGLNQLAKVVVQYIQAVYTQQKTIRLFQPNNKPKTVQLNQPVYDEFGVDVISRINDVSVGYQDVIVVSGSTMRSNRFADLDILVNLWDKGILRVDEPILRKTNIQNVDDIIAEHGVLAQLQQQNQSLQEELKKVQGDLQTAEREVVHSGRKADAEKFKKSLGIAEANITADAELEIARMRDARKDLDSIVQSVRS